MPKGDERPSRVHKKSSRFRGEARALGVRVRQLRHAQDMTLEQAAERMDLDLKHLQKIEAGLLNVTLVTLVRIAVGLRVPVATLFSRLSRRRGSAVPEVNE
jgi:transcriptional regulator with XRE-family HTH domain